LSDQQQLAIHHARVDQRVLIDVPSIIQAKSALRLKYLFQPAMCEAGIAYTFG